MLLGFENALFFEFTVGTSSRGRHTPDEEMYR